MILEERLKILDKNMNRCKWVNMKNKLYIDYHDKEWGVPEHDDKKLFELLVLETFEAGLSWECVLNKREDFRKAFDNFDYKKIAKYGEKKVEELIGNEKIIRNKLKINNTIRIAKIYMDIQKEFGSFDKYIWSFTDGKIIKNKDDKFLTHSSLSDTISKDLNKHGMKFVGTVIIYSYLHAIGIINDHELGCSFKDVC